MAKVIIIGPAHPLRGGLATFNQRLAKQFTNEGHECSIVSFSLQYPSFLFPGITQYSTDPAPQDLTIHTLINSVNPLNWLSVGKKLKKWKPDLIVVRYWLPFMGPALGTILRQVKKNRHTKIVCIADNVIPHEKRPGDIPFTKYFLKAVDAFVTMSEKVLSDLRKFTGQPAQLVQHPLYDNFGEPISKNDARKFLGLNESGKIILFFGFIRQYKGLDLLLKALADERIRNENIMLLVAGEFYEDDKPYQQLIQENNLQEQVILKTNFIPDSEVKYYLCSGDCVVQPYKNATQSGVTPLAYHFEKPMIVTNVGGLPSLVPHEKVGLVCEPDSKSIAESILRFYQLGEQYFIPHLRSEKQKYSWSKLTEAIFNLAEKNSER
ncbi:MAG TPA: glycosyltransferase [Flavisolibacter sp.]|jgi:glycosyltransferase involved in cell wall biosynthesis|nr:glycosyltransferase [Flavisolibacter sp.]